MKAAWFLCVCALLLDFQLTLGQQEECPSTSELSIEDQMPPDFDARHVRDIALAFSRNANETGNVATALRQALTFLNTSVLLRNWLEAIYYIYHAPVSTKYQIERMFDERNHLENRVLSAHFLLYESGEMMLAFQDPKNNLTSDKQGALGYFLVFATVFASFGDFLLTHERGRGYEGRIEADFAQLSGLLERYGKAGWTERVDPFTIENRTECGSTLSVAVVNKRTSKYVCGMSNKCFNRYVQKELTERRKYIDIVDAVLKVLNPQCGSRTQGGVPRGEAQKEFYPLLWNPKCSSGATPEPDLCACGQSNVTRNIQEGTEVSEGEIPWRAFVAINQMTLSGEDNVSCTGTILAPRWILTAGHCFGRNPADIRRVHVKAGMVSLRDSMQFDAESIFIPKGYTYNKHSRKNKIALIKLAQDLPFGSTISPCCLPYNFTNRPTASESVLDSGWGKTPENPSMKTLRKAEFNVLTMEQCQSRAGRLKVQRTHVCACTNGTDTSQATKTSSHNIDYLDGGKHYVIGVESRRYTGTVDKPNTVVLYTRISEYIKWIEERTGITSFCKN